MTPLEFAFLVGMATNPQAYKVGVEAHYGPAVIGFQAVASAPFEAYTFVGIQSTYKLGGGWHISPMMAAGVYYEDRPRNVWRDYGHWTVQYQARLVVSYRLANGYSAGLYADHTTNLKGDSWKHGFNTAISGPSVGFVIGKGF